MLKLCRWLPKKLGYLERGVKRKFCNLILESTYKKPPILLLALLLTACSDGSDSRRINDDNADDVNPYSGYTSEQYDSPENWLCRPDLEGERNACAGDLSSTVVFADGSTQLEESITAEDQPVDCFFVYPTVSADTSDNSDLFAGTAEIGAAFTLVARYRGGCKIFAPVYRQITLAALISGKYFDSDLNDVAYNDVVDAFKQFIANGDGRGFILVSHSQGSTHLIRLVQEEIEQDPYLAKRMIAAHLIGWAVALPNNAEVGATFESTPPCTFDNAVGCFVNYSSFKEEIPPIEEAALGFHYGVTESEDTRAACTNPVDLGGGRVNLDSYFPLSRFEPYEDPERNEAITTTFVKVPGLFQGECIEQGGQGYLSIVIDSDPSDPRIDDIASHVLPGWGLHGVDVFLGQGDLVMLAKRQAEEWLNP